jgi:hypothetical protein
MITVHPIAVTSFPYFYELPLLSSFGLSFWHLFFFCYVHQVGYSRYRCAEGEPRFRHRFASVHGQFRLSLPPFPPFRARHCATSHSAPKHKIAISSPSSLKKPPTCAFRGRYPRCPPPSLSLCVYVPLIVHSNPAIQLPDRTSKVGE